MKIAATGEALIYRHNGSYFNTRRIIDIVVASLALIVSSPLLLLAALAIKLEDRGPVMFTQKRVGRYEKLFTIYKLRTMRMTACGDAASPTTDRDSRISRVGLFLRKSSIDELPQFINVLKGDMTLVGPRPEMPFIVKKYEDWQHLRHLVTPGITGLWQATCRSKIPLHKPEATMIDLAYIATASHATDGKIILKTVHALVVARGAY